MSVRRGFTLVELLIALSLLAIVGATIARLVTGQQRFYASVDARLAMHSRVRDGADILAIALRHAAVQGSPITLATDTAIELSTIIGVGTVCGGSGARVALAPETLANALPLTALAVSPDSLDELFVFDQHAPAQWRHARIVDVTATPASTWCGASPLLSATDVASGRVTELTVSPPVTLASGAPARLLRHVRFDVYRAGDGLLYLGYRRCPLGCTAVQPVSGPYGSAAGAIMLRYFDVTGSSLLTPVSVAALARITRVDVIVRASSARVLDLPGRGRGLARDSAVASIALRNAP